jgi:branched-chain amino acid transport system ATP-binding protein
MPEPMLKLTDVTTHYGPLRVLHRLNIEVGEKEIVCLLGGNASGKSTTMKTILGIVKPTTGSVEFMKERIDGLATQNRPSGISPVPEAEGSLPVSPSKENLNYAFMHRKSRIIWSGRMEKVFDLFPKLAWQLSQDAYPQYWEQQMLAIRRTLMANPK